MTEAARREAQSRIKASFRKICEEEGTPHEQQEIIFDGIDLLFDFFDNIALIAKNHSK